MAVTNREKVLMKCFAHVWCQYEVILILLIYIINTKSFSGWVSKTRYNIVSNNFCFLIFIKSFYLERILWRIFNSIIIIYSLNLQIHVVTKSNTTWACWCHTWTWRVRFVVLWSLNQWCWTSWHRPLAVVIHRRTQSCCCARCSCISWRPNLNHMQLVQRGVKQYFFGLSLPCTWWTLKLSRCQRTNSFRWALFD